MYFNNLLWNRFTPLILNFIVYPFIILLNYFENYRYIYVKITTPDNLNISILQTIIKTHKGVRTIASLGN